MAASRSNELSSVEKGLLIIRALGATTKGMTPSELAVETGLNRSTAYGSVRSSRRTAGC